MRDSKPIRNRTAIIQGRKTRKSSTERKRTSRQAAKLRETLSSPEARARMSAASKNSWTPERRARQAATLKKTWTDPGVRVRRIAGIKKAWTPERRDAQRAATKKIMADPRMNARRIAGLRRVSADPELNALRIANLRKASADPAARKRRIQKLKKATSDPAVRARISNRLKNMWTEFRAARAVPTRAARTRSRPGRPSMDKRNSRIIELKDLGLKWREIAGDVDPSFAKDPRAAIERVRAAYKAASPSRKRERPL